MKVLLLLLLYVSHSALRLDVGCVEKGLTGAALNETLRLHLKELLMLLDVQALLIVLGVGRVGGRGPRSDETVVGDHDR